MAVLLAGHLVHLPKDSNGEVLQVENERTYFRVARGSDEEM